MKIYIEKIFEEFVQDNNSPEAKIRRYLERKRKEKEEREMNKLHPKTKGELQGLIIKEIEEKGSDVDLNHIDVSNIDDMSFLFYTYYDIDDEDNNQILRSFSGDISEWDVSNMTNMDGMFRSAKSFNGDISEWDVSNVEDMSFMFCSATNFNRDISDWDVSSVTAMYNMFQYATNFNQDISDWCVNGVENMDNMFYGAKSFDQDLSEWEVDNTFYSIDTFKDCPILDSHKPHFNEDNFILQ